MLYEKRHRRNRLNIATAGLIALLSLPFAPQSWGLTASEEAAQSQRSATPAERQRRTRTCELPIHDRNAQGDIITLGGAFRGTLVKLPAIDILALIALQHDGKPEDTYSVVRWPDLPNGGLAGTDFCGAVTLINLDRMSQEGDLLQVNGLQLRRSLALAKSYPAAARQIRNRGQLMTLPAGAYVAVVDAEPEKMNAWLREEYRAVAGSDGAIPALRIGDVTLIPFTSDMK